MSVYHLKPCMSRSRTAWSRRVSLTERCRSSFTLTVMCRFLPFLSSGDAVDNRQLEVQALSARFRAGARRWCRVVEEGFHLYGEVNTLMTLNCSLPLKCSVF
jgi:hypothetical protein